MNKKEHSLTHVNIKLPDVFMKEMKEKSKIENVYLYPQEPSNPILNSLRKNLINFDHFRNAYKNKAFFEIMQTSDIILKLSVKTLLVRQ